MAYANKKVLMNAIRKKHPPEKKDLPPAQGSGYLPISDEGSIKETAASEQPSQAKGESRHSAYNVRKEDSL